MYTDLKTNACIALIGITFLLSCNKNPATTPTELHIIKAKLLEYGSDNPIAGAYLNVWINPVGKITAITDGKGECTFEGENVAFRSFSKQGYWDYNFSDKQFSPLLLFPGNTMLNTRTGLVFDCDSFVLKLIPKSFITVHLKDSLGLNTCLDCNVFINVNGTYTMNGMNSTVYDSLAINKIKESVLLRPQIDTTFQLAIFGNAINTFNIYKDDGSDGFGYYDLLKKQSKLIPDKTSLFLNITY